MAETKKRPKNAQGGGKKHKIHKPDPMVYEHDEDDDDDLFDRINGTCPAPPPTPAPPPPSREDKIKDALRHGGDSDSDSDSDRRTKKVRKPPPATKRPTTPLPPAGAAAAAPAPAPARSKSKKAKGKERQNTADQHKSLYKANMVSKTDESRIIRMPDCLAQGELSVDLFEVIEKMYGAATWDDNRDTDLPLFQIDHEENNRAAMMHKGVFNNPKVFTLIRRMLNRNPEGKLNTQQLQNEIANLYNIEPVPRAYEETMLYSPKDGERPCCNGEGCKAFKWWGFIMKEFITPLELAQMKDSRARNNIVKMCLVCVRNNIDFLQTSCIVGGLHNPENYINQQHRNMVNKKDEYTFEYSIPLGNGIVYPVIMNHRLGYKYHTDGKMHWVTQDGYRKCTQEDIEQQNFRIGTPRQKNPANGSPQSQESQLSAAQNY